MPVSFENTDIAFRHKDDKSLRKAYWLFRMVSSPSLVSLGEHLVNAALWLKIPISGIVRQTIFHQFCGGETVSEAAAATQALDLAKIGTILDYSVEGKQTNESFENSFNEILKVLEIAKGNVHVPFAVFKVTGIVRLTLLEKVNTGNKLNQSEQEELNQAYNRVDQLCRKAHDSKTPILVDAEESWIQNEIDSWVEKMIIQYNKEIPIVYQTLQLYRKDKLQYLKDLFHRAERENVKLGIKLVRGAYMEKEAERAEEFGYESPIHLTKAATDRDYNEALKFCMQHLDRIHLLSGTHNEESSQLLIDLMKTFKVAPSDPRVYSAQLFGMSDHISFNLANAGYNVAKYVPYGPVKEVIPYLIRRAQENTSVAGQTGRELSLILREIQRRKSA